MWDDNTLMRVAEVYGPYNWTNAVTPEAQIALGKDIIKFLDIFDIIPVATQHFDGFCIH